jgi:hypothetical protein
MKPLLCRYRGAIWEALTRMGWITAYVSGEFAYMTQTRIIKQEKI